MKDRAYTCVLCATGGPCRQTEKCQRFHKGLEEVTDGVFKYPDYAPGEKLRCWLKHPGEDSVCESSLTSKISLLEHQRWKEHLVFCRDCGVWYEKEKPCSHPLRLQSEVAEADSNA